MKAAVFSIGTELTRGELTNTNASWLAEQLTLIGCTVVEQSTIPDDAELIRATLLRLSTSHGVVVCTGGLGPTTDDLTTAAAAAAAGVELVRHEASLDAIRRRFRAANREMSPSNTKQADFPRGADVLDNPVGTAPGFAITLGACRCFFLPGVPHEMERIFDDRIRPELAPTVERTTHQVRLRTFGLPESQVGERLSGIEEAFEGITLGYRASFPEIEVKILAEGPSLAVAQERAALAEREVRDRLEDAVFGEDDDTYPAYVGHLLRDRGLTVALAESCTGGMVSSLITDVPGSSDYLLLSAVTYSNASKTNVLGVSGELLRGYGAVSAESAAAMADGVRRLADADLAVSITGIAGPGGGSESKPVGTVFIALARRDRETATEALKLSGDRWRIRRLAAYCALRVLARVAIAH